MVALKHDVCVNTLAFDAVRKPDYRRLHHPSMHVEGVFDLGGSDTVPAYVEHVVHSPRNSVVTVLVAQAPVTSEIKSGIGPEIGLSAAFVVAVRGAQHSWPRRANAKVSAHPVTVDFGTLFVNQQRLNAGHGKRGKRGFRRCDPREVGDEHSTGLGLPPGVNNGALSLANMSVVPVPRFFINGLTDGSEHLKTVEFLAAKGLLAKPHQAANGGRSRVQNIHLVAVHNVPKTSGIGPRGHAFKHQRGGSSTQRAIYQVAVPGNPTDVGRTEMNLARLVLKGVDKRVSRPHHVSGTGVHHAFGLAG